ncbi:MAG: DUF5107 domain-containing protein [Kiritimatiellaeota bacterium]|nr:DUF5107 domain-containing protein [Kiritimatiellota bacterium]
MQPVKLYETIEEINEHNQLPLNPHPPYGLITGYHCYPFLFYGSKQFQVTRRRVKILVAENEYLRIGMAPGYGGRLWFMYDKINRRDVIHRVHTDAKMYNAGMGFNYMGGGLELNLPNAHSYTNVRRRFCTAEKNTDGSVSLIMSNTEKIGRIHWTVSFSLFPGEARVVQKVRIANETPFEEKYLYWANCGIPVGANTEFIYPEASGAMHGKFQNVISWPTFMKSNIGVLKNVDGMFGLYMLGARQGYFGYYDHDAKSGMLHYADVNDLPGKKYWSWGWHASGQHTAFTHNDHGKCYGEVQSGRIIIQEEFDRILPMTNASWTEYWYPYRQIGVVNAAYADVGVNFVLSSSGAKTKADIKIFANRPFAGMDLVVRKGTKILATLNGINLRTAQSFAVEKDIPAARRERNEIGLEIVGKKGGIIASVPAQKDKPEPMDTYFVPDKYPVPKAEDFTAEGCFFRAEKLAREWMFHLSEIRKLLEAALKVDPDFSRAHGELGLLNLRVGEFQKAIEHFDKALDRIYDDGRLLYYKGLAFMLSGNVKEAAYHLRQAGRFGYECQERIAEAQMAIQRGNYAEASNHLDRAMALNGTMVLAPVLKALVLNRLGRKKEARENLMEAKRQSPFSPLVIAGEYVLQNRDAATKQTIQQRYLSVPEEILDVVSTLYFSGLADEARDLLATLEIENSMVAFYRSRLEKETGRRVKAARKTDPARADDFAWKTVDLLMLRKNLAENPKDARVHYHLGNFYYGHGFEAQGIHAWEKAHALGRRDKILLYEMARAYKRKGDKAKYARLLTEAYQTDRTDPYIYDDYVALMQEKNGMAAATAFMEKDLRHIRKYFTASSLLMNNYLMRGAYEKLEKFIAGVNFGDFWRSGIASYYVTLRLAQGYRALSAKRYRPALAYFEQALDVPDTLGKNYFVPYPERVRRLFYMGLCKRYLGKEEGARQHWEEALAFDQQATFEPSCDFQIMKTRYYQAFCLRGLGRFAEAEVYVHGIRKFAQNAGLDKASKQMLIRWAFLGREKDITKFDWFDTELGVTAFTAMATSVED